jgi:hypothetical protein
MFEAFFADEAEEHPFFAGRSHHGTEISRIVGEQAIVAD